MSHRSSLFAFATLALWALCSSCASTVVPPRALTTRYLQVFGTGVHYDSQGRLVGMFIDVVPRRQAPDGGPIYLEATFENPQAGARPLVVRGDSRQATSIGVDLKTTPVNGMQDRKLYAITVRAYADKARTRLLDTLDQAMVYHDVGDPEAILHGGRLPRGMRMARPSGTGN